MFDRFITFCPTAITGGVEAMHQLSDSLHSRGLHVTMAYYGMNNTLVIDNDEIKSVGDLSPNFLSSYDTYKSSSAQSIHLTKNTLCIFPEAKAGMAWSWKYTPKAIWWLSVDNFKITHPNLLNQSTLVRLFKDESILHLYQSHYAQDFLLRHGARSIFPLYDYVSTSYHMTSTNQLHNEKSIDISLFPRKGRDLAEEFLNHGGNKLSRIAIQDMNSEQVKAALASSRIYIDFGHQPGKDRVPREAACMECIVFLHEQGSACFFEDHPLHSEYIFTSHDVMSGTLLSKVQQVLKDPAYHLKRQEIYLKRIKAEKSEFDWQVQMLFG